MKIKKDESGNIWVDGDLCINVPVTIKHIAEAHLSTYEDLVDFVDASVIYYVSELKNG